MKNFMRISVLFLFLFILGSSFQSKSSVFGRADWIPMVVQVACSTDPTVYAQYEGAEKQCVGWGGLCSGQGTLTITSFDPIHPCPPQ